jgi:hypothetical protein
MTQEYDHYLGVSSAIKRAESLGLILDWKADHWSICIEKKQRRVCCKGKTLLELHHYLNGYEDGLRKK